MKKSCLLLLLIFLPISFLIAQEFSNKGKDFWLGYGYHVRYVTGNPVNQQEMILYFTSDQNAKVTVEIPNIGYTIQYDVIANQVTPSQPIPKVGGQDARLTVPGISNKGIHITSDKPIVAYAHIYNASVSGASLLFPTNTLGKEYYSVNYTQRSNEGASNSFFFVVATEDGTQIEITPSASNLNGLAVGVPSAPITLKKGEIYNVMGTLIGSTGSDLTGSKIRSISASGAPCKPIAVFSGSGKISIGGPGNGSADNLFAQAFPSKAWGLKYLTVPTGTQPNNFYRVCVKDPTTNVKLNGVDLPKSSLQNGFYYEFRNAGGISAPKPNVIEADQPILVSQYMTTQGQEGNPNFSGVSGNGIGGDPEMIYLSPVEQTINKITLYSAAQFQILRSYINVVIKKEGVANFKIDGAAPAPGSFSPHPEDPLYAYAILQVSNGSHSLSADSGFNAIAYGFGNAESYGYNAGTNIVDLNPPVTIQNQFPNVATVNYSATCVNTSFNLKLALSYQPSKIVLDFLGASNLTGPPILTYTPTGFDSTYTSNGKPFYVYKIPQAYIFGAAGTYPIKFTTTSLLPQSDGCSNNNEQEITDNVVVSDAPIADFSISSVDSGCVNASINFRDLSNGSGRSVVGWIWDFGDGANNSIQNPSRTYASAGNYNAKLTTITDFGCVATKTVPISLSNKPVARFTVPAITCENSAINFTDASSIVPGAANNTITQWKWNLDNGAGIVTVNANTAQTNTYTSWGAKDVYLNVVSNTGCLSDSFRIPGGFKINPLPVVGFVLPEVCLNDATATFTDTSKIADGTESGFSYLWKFDDGVSTVDPTKRPVPLTANTSSKSIAASYKTFGNYTVSLQVTSNNGCITTDNKSFTVNGSTPVPKFEVANLLNGIPLCTNDSIKIINQSTVDFGDVTKLEVVWDLLSAPTTIVTDQSPTLNKQYAIRYGIPTTISTPATIDYSVRIRAFSGQAESCSRTLTKIVTVTYAPAVSFNDIRDICYDATPRLITQGNFISALPTTQTYSGKGISAAGLLNPITTGVGNDTLKYFVQNNAGCKDSAFQPITVWPSPVAKWGIADPACEKNNLLFTDSSVANFSNIAQWNWNFGDGKTESRTNGTAFTHVFDTAQTYTSSLRVVTDSGCVSTSNQQIIRINHLPKPAFSLPEICLPDGRGTFMNQSTITDGSEALFSYVWNFGDPNDPSSSTLRQPTHKYSAVGPNNVQLKITSKDGCVDSLTRVLNTIYPWPKANFSASQTAICQGDPIQFTGLGNGFTSAPVRWEWNLGGGATSTLQNPRKIFTDSGSFTISYYFFNSQGCVSDTVSQTVVVHPYPVLELGPNIVVLEGGTKSLKPEFVYGTNLIYQWSPSLYLNSVTDSIPKTTPLGDITYRLNLTGIGGCMVTDTIFIKLLLNPIIPNAFSPNGDGIHDRWRIQYLESYPGATVDVYDRYGMLVYNSIEYAVDWDGTRNGKPLPIGTYYYVINPKNGRKIITGSVTIIK